MMLVNICGGLTNVVPICYRSSKFCLLLLLTYLKVCRDESSDEEDVALTELVLKIQ